MTFRRYFYGFLQADEAQTILSKKDVGCFLLRFSSTPKLLTLSTLSSSGVVHCRLAARSTPNGFCIVLDNVFSTMDEILASNAMSVTNPCDRSVDHI
jgi:hypothetical protein